MKYLFLLFAFLFTSSSFAQADKKAALEQQKKDNLSKIKELNSIISRTSKKKKASIGKLNVLKEQIGVQKKQISVLEQNQQILAEEAQKLRNEGDVLKAKLERLKKQYALMIYEAQKTSSVYNKMSFLLLSNDLGEFVRRFDYLRHYSTNRKKQADLIFKTRQDLMTKEQKVVFKKQEEQKVIVEKEGEKKKLEVLKTKEDQVVTVLTQQEKKLKIELEKKKLSVRKLDNLIAGIVQREIQKSIERERKLRQARQVKKVEVAKPTLPELKKGETTKILAEKQVEKKESPKEEKKAAVAEAKKSKAEPAPAAAVEEKKIESNTYYMNADEAKLASSFAALRGRMPFPVPSGFISDHFGVHKHPLLKGVMINNNGIDIQTSPGSPVHSVYDGVVQSVVNIPGINMVVAIQHGDYFTVYSKLANVSVSVGTRVRTGQRIGSVASDEDGTAEINFQVWKNTVRQNPESWLRR
ncbi:murein hydrolase activator EnvC family protein [Aquirufa antheringensis]|uniref:murein hydrolase activator EnvC family protein n=1 Tax=Aquirufa antheringensis TaxID=2516559 RepID=UPI001032DF7E|nr:M23 family metallopeptidase [Aquirufa antheringensis]MCZ2488236.1 peptidoglycan DD-metalloendopeptidase family protein [Aquirufa antheringensis]MCZ2490222.1 peptidoglycan DD-metalloendopeptidase family protein [Aquirufa antheringensis]TBH70258.1 peptidase M23 [Aquirufa antheringensis]USQ03929.1 peptidoglycan DD-metalloendopeptidase family protein [Aquirufa antheringensis]